jgi:hypothetical protein
LDGETCVGRGMTNYNEQPRSKLRGIKTLKT